MLNVLKSINIATFGKISVVTLALIMAMSVGAGIFWVINAKQLDIKFSDYEKTTERKTALLAFMQGAIGYGGLIHSVNNFVLRKDISQLINGHESVLELDVILRAYRQIGISPSEEQALSKIELVRSNYRQALVRAEILIRQGQPVEEIDRVIKVDDGPAILALKELKKVYVFP